MKFTKMHGAGNDYVYVNCFEEQVADPASVAGVLNGLTERKILNHLAGGDLELEWTEEGPATEVFTGEIEI